MEHPIIYSKKINSIGIFLGQRVVLNFFIFYFSCGEKFPCCPPVSGSLTENEQAVPKGQGDAAGSMSRRALLMDWEKRTEQEGRRRLQGRRS